MSDTATLRHRLEIQGFHLDDVALAEVGPWLRLSPALCAAGIAAGTILASPPVLWTFAGIALLGAALPFHPFDLVYNLGVRHLTGARPLPPNGPPRRFACGVAAVWLAGTGLAFYGGVTTLGYVLGGALTAAVGLVAATHVCVASLVYDALFGHRPTAGTSAPRGAR